MPSQSSFSKRSTSALVFFTFFALAFTVLAAPSLAYAWNPLDSLKDFAGTTFGFITGPVAGIAQTIANAFLNVLTLFVFKVPLAVSSVFYVLSATVLGWVSDENFIPFSVTGQDNAVVYNAWELMRNFANMGFILALVAIALGTAFRISEYQLQRALPRLIIIALLINFTPVFVGLIIDVSNIAMRFFLDMVGANFFEASKQVFGFGLDMITGIASKEPTEYAAAIIAQIFFNAVAALIFFLFSMLFFARYIALWILFILSPLAFFSYILPITKRFWNMWWHQFIQWCIIGVSGAFFLFLGSQMTAFMWNNPLQTPGTDVEGAFGWFSDFFGALAVMLVPIAILIMGFFISLSTSAMGASTVTNVARTAGTWAATKGKTWGKQRYQVARETISRSEATKKIAQRMAIIPTWGEGQKGITGLAKRTASGFVVPAARWAGRGTGSVLIGQEIQEIDQAKADMKKLRTPAEKLAAIRSATTRAQRVGQILAAIEDNQLGLLQKVGLSEKEITRIGQEAAIANPSHAFNVAQATPHLGQAIADGLTAERKKTSGLELKDAEEKEKYQTLTRKLYATTKPKIIEGSWSPNTALDNKNKLRPDIGEAIREHWRGDQLGAAGKTLGKAFIDAVNEHFEQNGITEDWLKKYNAPLLKYLQRSIAQEMGFRVPSGPATAPPPPAPAPSPPGGGTPPGGGGGNPPPRGGNGEGHTWRGPGTGSPGRGGSGTDGGHTWRP